MCILTAIFPLEKAVVTEDIRSSSVRFGAESMATEHEMADRESEEPGEREPEGENMFFLPRTAPHRTAPHRTAPL